MADGRSTPAMGQGQVYLSNLLFLDDVLLVPAFPNSLISVHKLTTSLGCVVVFFNKSMCVFRDVAHQKELGRGSSRDGLYFLDAPSTSSNKVVATVSSSTAHHWHSRLGHPNLSKLKCLVPSLKHVSSLDCESCQVSKHPRTSFPISQSSRSSKPFNVIHSDIWGPLNVSNRSQLKYYVIFLDDFSKMT